MDFIAIINLSTAVILALLLLLMTFEPAQIKFYGIMGIGIMVAPLILAVIGNSAGWFSVSYLKIIVLEQGVFSIAIATGYGAVTGLTLNMVKRSIIHAFRKWKADRSSIESSS